MLLLRWKNRHFYVPRPSVFVCPGDAHVAITQNVVWMKRHYSVLAEPLAACTHLSSTVSQLFEPQKQKNCRFHVPQLTFCFPWRRPFDYHAIRCMDYRLVVLKSGLGLKSGLIHFCWIWTWTWKPWTWTWTWTWRFFQQALWQVHVV